MMNYLQIYNLEENLRNQHRKRSIEGKGTDSSRNDTISTQLDNTFENTNYLSADFIEKLEKKTFKHAVVSLYLNFNARKNIGEPKLFLSHLNSLITEELKNNTAYLKTLNKAQEKILEQDIETIKTFLTSGLFIEDFESIVLFKSNNELTSIMKLPIQVKDHVQISNTPHTAPLQSILQEQKKVLVSLVTKGISTMYIYNLGRIEKVKTIENNIMPDKVDKSPSKIQQHRLDHLQKHFKETADYIYKQCSNNTVDHVVIIGHEEITTKKFLDSLHADVHNKLIGFEYCSPEELMDENTIPSIVRDALIDHTIMQEQHIDKKLAAAKGQSQLVMGVEQILHAINRGMVRSLYIDGTHIMKGFKCPNDNNLSLVDRKCPVCDRNPIPVENIVDELITIAKQSTKDVFVFEHEPERMNQYNHACAILLTST